MNTRRGHWWTSHEVGLILVLTDLVCLIVVAEVTAEVDAGAALFAVLLLTLNSGAGLYRTRATLSVLRDTPVLAVRFLAATGLTAVIVLLAGYPQGLATAGHVGVLAAALYLSRAAVYAVIRGLRRRGWLTSTVLIIGSGPDAFDLATALTRHRVYGQRPVAYLDNGSVPPEPMPIPCAGTVDEADVGAVVADCAVDIVLVSGSGPSTAAGVATIRSMDRVDVEVLLIPRMWQVTPTRKASDIIGDVPLVRLPRKTWRSVGWTTKRLADRVGAAIAVIVLSPLLAALWLAVRIDGGPGVIFSQDRIGVDGRVFRVHKFRSMAPADPGESDTTWSIAGDARVSGLGRLLRRTSLDELPQLVNILTGDMSFVGPRPERPAFAAEFAAHYPSYTDRSRVPCGLTGWAQIHGLRGDTSIATRARYDNYYIENWSPWLDVTILVRTIPAMLEGS